MGTFYMIEITIPFIATQAVLAQVGNFCNQITIQGLNSNVCLICFDLITFTIVTDSAMMVMIE